MKIHHLEVYRAKDGWRWRVLARNKKIVAESGESYQRRKSMLRSLANALRNPGLLTAVEAALQDKA